MKHISKFQYAPFLIPKFRYSTFPFLSSLRYSIFNIRYSIFLFLFLPFSLPAQQQWAEPVNISNLGGYSKDPDMVIDHNGVIHVAWSYRITQTHWLIMYTSSKDDGQTWTEPLDLLQNTDLWMSQPHIACDSKNNLYVTYTYNTIDYNNMLIKMLIYDGHQWGDSIVISEGLPGSDYSKVLVDRNERVFVFWGYASQFMYYKYRENGTWSEYYCPFCDSIDTFAFSEGHVVSNNLMHWVGASLSANYHGERPQYYKYNLANNLWTYPEMINNDTIVVDIDISLNHSYVPETAYRKKSTIAVGVTIDSTMHTIKEGNNWSVPDLVAGTDKRQVGQQIAIDQNNDVHVVEIEYYNSSDPEGTLAHYQKEKEIWICKPIDSASHMINFPKMIFSGNNLYVAYYKGEVVFQGDIWISKYDIITNIEESNQPTKLTIYPNPGKDNIYIEFVPLVSHGKNNQPQHIDISVFDIKGQHIVTLANKTFPPGKQRLLWNGMGKNGKEVNNGAYIIRLKSGRNSVSQTVEIIK